MTFKEGWVAPRLIEDYEFGETLQIVDREKVFAGYDMDGHLIEHAFLLETGSRWSSPESYDRYRSLIHSTSALIRAIEDQAYTELNGEPKERLADVQEIIDLGILQGPNVPRYAGRIEGDDK